MIKECNEHEMPRQAPGENKVWRAGIGAVLSEVDDTLLGNGIGEGDCIQCIDGFSALMPVVLTDPERPGWWALGFAPNAAAFDRLKASGEHVILLWRPSIERLLEIITDDAPDERVADG